MSVDKNALNTLAQKLLANIEAADRNPHALPTRLDSEEFIVRVQLSHERHYPQVHQLLEEARFTRTLTTQDGVQRDQPGGRVLAITPGLNGNGASFEP